MRKQTLSACALLLSSMTASYAGTMGEEAPRLLVPFLAGEGMYTWPDMGKGFELSVQNIGTFGSAKNDNGWGGRVAAGVLHNWSEKWAGSFELGWGYYGETDFTPSVTLASGVTVTAGNSLRTMINQYGFDVLFGALYMKPKYDLFFKAGALVQNTRIKIHLNPTGLEGAARQNFDQLTARFPGVYGLNRVASNVLPEIKLGGAYHVYQDWNLTLSWMHAFGTKLNTSRMGFQTSPLTALTHFSGYVYSPSLNTVLFGIERRFS